MIRGVDIADQAELLVGRRWKRNGRDMGLDCCGVVVCAARNAGLSVEDCSSYDVSCAPQGLMEDFCQRNGTLLGPKHREPGMVFLMQVPGLQGVSHMGIISTYDRVIHMDASRRRVVVENFLWLDKRCSMTMKFNGVE